MNLKQLGILFVTSLIVFFASCSDDDPKTTDNLASQIKGKYTGELVTTLSGKLITTTRSLTLSEAGVNEINLELKNFTEEGKIIGDILLNKIALSGKDGSIVLKENTQEIELINGKAQVSSSGTVKDNNLELKLEITTADKKSTISIFKGKLTTEEDTDLAEKVKGEYKGDLGITLTEGGDIIASKDKITLERTANNELKLSLMDFSLDSKTKAGDIIIEKVLLEQTGEAVVLTETTAQITVLGGTKATVIVNGTVTGKDLDIQIKVLVAEIDPIKVTFKGKLSDGTEETEDLAEKAKGEYKGDLGVLLTEDGDLISSKDKITLERTAKNELKLSLMDFSLDRLEVGNIIIEKVLLEQSGESIVLTETTAKLTVLNGIGATVIVNGTVTGEDLDIQIKVLVADFDDPIKVTFKGKLSDGTEEPEDKTNYAKVAAGVYKGTLTEKTKSDGTYKVQLQETTTDNVATLKLQSFFLGERAIEEAILTAVAVTGEGNVVTLTESTQDVKLADGTTVKVTISGTVNTADKSASLNLKFVEGTTTQERAFTGKLTEEGFDFGKLEKPEPEDKTDYAKVIASNYKGALKRTIGTNVEEADEIIVVERTADNEITMTLKNLIVDNKNVGDVVISKIPVTGKDGTTTTLTETKAEVKLADGTVWQVTVNGSVSDKGIATFDINATPSGSQENIILNFSKGGKTEDTEIKRSDLANILELTFNSDKVLKQSNIISGNTSISFAVNKNTITPVEKVRMEFSINVSEGATVITPTGNALDLSRGKAEIKVISQDKKVTKTYEITMVETAKTASMLFDMNSWAIEPNTNTATGAKALAPTTTLGEFATWGTSNAGSNMAGKKLCITEEAVDSRSGSAARIQTQNTKPSSFLASMIPMVTSGSLFLGEFKLNAGVPLQSTRFGVPFDKKPIKVSGYFKYTAGADYYEVPEGSKKIGAPVLNPDKKDKCAINVIFYDITDDQGYITGKDTYEDTRIIAINQFEHGNTNGYQEFSLALDYSKAYDNNRKYRIAIIASSSYDGAKYNGAPESVLLLDDITLTYED